MHRIFWQSKGESANIYKFFINFGHFPLYKQGRLYYDITVSTPDV